MDIKKFNLYNKIAAAAALVISAVTYLLTIEPSASFWDCGEFIASSYKLEVGHPPGNPVFQLFARIFTLLGDGAHAAELGFEIGHEIVEEGRSMADFGDADAVADIP